MISYQTMVNKFLLFWALLGFLPAYSVVTHLTILEKNGNLALVFTENGFDKIGKHGGILQQLASLKYAKEKKAYVIGTDFSEHNKTRSQYYTQLQDQYRTKQTFKVAESDKLPNGFYKGAHVLENLMRKCTKLNIESYNAAFHESKVDEVRKECVTVLGALVTKNKDFVMPCEQNINSPEQLVALRAFVKTMDIHKQARKCVIIVSFPLLTNDIKSYLQQNEYQIVYQVGSMSSAQDSHEQLVNNALDLPYLFDELKYMHRCLWCPSCFTQAPLFEQHLNNDCAVKNKFLRTLSFKQKAGQLTQMLSTMKIAGDNAKESYKSIMTQHEAMRKKYKESTDSKEKQELKIRCAELGKIFKIMGQEKKFMLEHYNKSKQVELENVKLTTIKEEPAAQTTTGVFNLRDTDNKRSTLPSVPAELDEVPKSWTRPSSLETATVYSSNNSSTYVPNATTQTEMPVVNALHELQENTARDHLGNKSSSKQEEVELPIKDKTYKKRKAPKKAYEKSSTAKKFKYEPYGKTNQFKFKRSWKKPQGTDISRWTKSLAVGLIAGLGTFKLGSWLAGTQA